ncbi:sporulation membrane protein YtaF [Amphibacillus sp. Q70]|uniref:sporulation membrane protein YtaF n=1 Tax=Amphibacillus sp. Q70 TaxID=3453416 RepID=UPI003F85FE95
MEMFDILSLFFLVIAVSIDSFMVAFSYGLKKLNLAPTVIGLIGICSGLAFGLSMIAGQVLAFFITETLMTVIGAVLLIGLGCYSLFSFDQPQEKPSSSKSYHLKFKRMDIVIKIFNKPVLADLDQSGDITGLETIWLALALSIDAGAAGLGASLVGFRLVAIVLIILMTIAFLVLGLFIGGKFAQKELHASIRYIPGLLLILIGISRLFIPV